MLAGERGTGEGEFARLVCTLKPHTEVVKALLEGMHPLAEKFPNVQFAVPDEEVIINDRPAAWAFVPDGLLNKEQRKELGNALLGL